MLPGLTLMLVEVSFFFVSKYYYILSFSLFQSKLILRTLKQEKYNLQQEKSETTLYALDLTQQVSSYTFKHEF